MDILIRRLSESEMEDLRIADWPVWTKEVSDFDWFYDCIEDCLILEGQVEVTSHNGEIVSFGAGDFVTFPNGLSCRWKVVAPVRKHYRFR